MKKIFPKALYLHFPFCKSKCSYCSFYSKRSENNYLKYITSLGLEMRDFFKNYQIGSLESFYLGGGTPSLLSVAELELLNKTLKSFGINLKSLKEVTIECNPESVSTEKLDFLREMGFSRISLGVQAYQDKILKRIGRIHGTREVELALERIISAGFDNISLDLMIGLPGQTLKDLKESLSFATSYSEVKHISLYSLELKEGTKLFRENPVLPSEDLERRMYWEGIEYLKSKGFKHYEISNLAVPGFESVHNNHYWDLSDYISFGPSASSFYENTRYTNFSDLSSYMNGIFGSEKLSYTEEMLRGDYMFLGLRKLEGVVDSDYKKRFGSSFFSDYGEEIEELVDRELLIREGDVIRLSRRGTDLANQVFLSFV